MNRLHLINLVLLSCILIGCSTYKRSYGETARAISLSDASSTYRLDLSNQNLTEVPKGFVEYTQLRMLNLSANTNIDLEQFLNQVPNPEVLEVLVLDSLNLKTIPASIKRLTNLKHLSLNANPEAHFDQLFKAVSSLPIEFINLQNNQIALLSKEVSALKNLKSINLSGNRLQTSENYILLGNLPKLESLWITNNQLNQLPLEIGQLSSLRNLYMEHNELTTLPDSLADLEKVWVLHAGHNKFKELPIVFTQMPSLLLLHINNNSITTIPEEYAQEKYSLMGLIMDHNSLSSAAIKRWEKEFSKFFQASL